MFLSKRAVFLNQYYTSKSTRSQKVLPHGHSANNGSDLQKIENQPIALLWEAAEALKQQNNAAYHALDIILMSLDIHMEIARPDRMVDNSDL